MAGKKKENPLTLVFHYPDGTYSEALSTEFGKLLAERIGESASEFMSEESYIRLAEYTES